MRPKTKERRNLTFQVKSHQIGLSRLHFHAWLHIRVNKEPFQYIHTQHLIGGRGSECKEQLGLRTTELAAKSVCQVQDKAWHDAVRMINIWWINTF